LIVTIVVIGGVVYFGSEIFGFIGNIFSSIFGGIGQGVTDMSQSQTSNTGGTGDDVIDSLAVGAAGGG
jgi:hypothetical protein